ncbi:hypothetical protein [Lysinibacillus fusiformis]
MTTDPSATPSELSTTPHDSMVMIMQHQQAAQIVQDSVSKWSLFLATMH